MSPDPGYRRRVRTPGGGHLDFRNYDTDLGFEFQAGTNFTVEFHYNSDDPDAEDARIEIEIRGEGAAGERLVVRWRAPGEAEWSAPSALPLGARPRAAALFVNRGLMLIEELSLSAP